MDRNTLEKHCEKKGFALSEFADKILLAINKRDGNCPCKVANIPCPCPDHEEDIQKKGRCCCNLFVKVEKNENKK